MMKNRQVEVNLSPRRGEDMHVKKRFLAGKTLQHSEECVRCLRKVDRPTRRIDRGGVQLVSVLGYSGVPCFKILHIYIYIKL